MEAYQAGPRWIDDGDSVPHGKHGVSHEEGDLVPIELHAGVDPCHEFVDDKVGGEGGEGQGVVIDHLWVHELWARLGDVIDHCAWRGTFLHHTEVGTARGGLGLECEQDDWKYQLQGKHGNGRHI